MNRMRRFPVLAWAFKLTLLFLVLAGLVCKNEKLSDCRSSLGRTLTALNNCMKEKGAAHPDCKDTFIIALFEFHRCEDLKNKPQVQP